MTESKEYIKMDEKSREKINLIRSSINNITDFLNKPKIQKLSKFITSISRTTRKLRNRSTPAFDMISTITSNMHAIEKDIDELESIIGSRRLQHEISTESIQKIWNAKTEKKYIIVFLAPFFNETRLRDGYYRRIKAIDDIMGDGCLKIYITPANYVLEEEFHQSFPDPSHLDLRIAFDDPEQVKSLELIISMSDLVYYHSIAFVNDISLKADKLQILDLHGSVPEESALQGNPEQAAILNEVEKRALENVDYAVVVSEAMARHLQHKHPSTKIPHITLPILDDQITCIERRIAPKPYEGGKPFVAYVGGMQKWQMIERMQSLIDLTHHLYNYLVLVPSPAEFLEHWQVNKIPPISVSSGDREEVRRVCNKAHYGLLLREDIIVNKVSCPTKLIEYLAFGVVPVLYSHQIGDFLDLGMKFITLADLESGKLPSEEERLTIVKENYECFEKFVNLYKTGKSNLRATLIKQ